MIPPFGLLIGALGMIVAARSVADPLAAELGTSESTASCTASRARGIGASYSGSANASSASPIVVSWLPPAATTTNCRESGRRR